MHQKRKLAACAAFVLLTIAATVYFCFPGQLLATITALQARRAGMSLKTVRIKGYRIPYYAGGAGPPLVLLHGFAESKMTFLQAAQWLGKHYTVYLPDLAGHGETALPYQDEKEPMDTPAKYDAFMHRVSAQPPGSPDRFRVASSSSPFRTSPGSIACWEICAKTATTC